MNFFKSLFHKAFESLPGDAFKEKYRTTKDSILIDVRSAGEFSGGTIKGARNINYLSRNFVEQIEGLDKTKNYFLFCKSGARSASASKKMAKLGFKVFNLSGGIHSWPNRN